MVLAQAPFAPEREVVLVVEDEFLIRMMISEDLREAGFSVIEAANGDEAATIFKSGVVIDFMFSDVQMPGVLDGLGLLALVREAQTDLPVVITSGHWRPDRGFADDFTQFLPKPYTAEQVLEIVRGRLAETE